MVSRTTRNRKMNIMNESIKFLFEKHLSDKAVNGYSNVYEDLFSPRKNDPISLLEIGIGTLNPTHSNMLFWKVKYPEYQPGASLRAFREYFPNGTIYGVDIQEDCLIYEERIKTFLMDSTDKITTDEVFGGVKFDFIVDDGDHRYETQIKTFENFFGKLNSNGVYILEDLENPDELLKYFATTKFNYELRDRMIIITR